MGFLLVVRCVAVVLALLRGEVGWHPPAGKHRHWWTADENAT